MKWLLLVFLPVGLCNAQITVTGTNFASAGDINVFSTVNPIDVNSPELTGTNYTWDFSTVGMMNQRSDTNLSVSSTPIGYQFYFNNGFLYPDHEASYGVLISTPDLSGQIPFDDVINFYRTETSGLFHVGFGATVSGIPFSVRNIPVDTVYDLPMTYGQVMSDSFVFSISLAGIGYYGQDGYHTDTVDGWGSITTPYGNFDVLRVKTVLFVTDTTYVNTLGFGTSVVRPVQTNYTWISETEGVPVFSVQTVGGLVVSAEYLDTLQGLGVSDVSANIDMSVFPNPANSQSTVVVETKENSSSILRLYNAVGEVVLERPLTLISGTNRIELNHDEMVTGLYMVEISTDNNRLSRQLLITK